MPDFAAMPLAELCRRRDGLEKKILFGRRAYDIGVGKVSDAIARRTRLDIDAMRAEADVIEGHIAARRNGGQRA